MPPPTDRTGVIHHREEPARSRVKREQLLSAQRLFAAALRVADSRTIEGDLLEGFGLLGPALGLGALWECGGGEEGVCWHDTARVDDVETTFSNEVVQAAGELTGIACMKGPGDTVLYLSPTSDASPARALVGLGRPGEPLDLAACFAFETIAGLIGSTRPRVAAVQALNRRLELQTFLLSVASMADLSNDEDITVKLLESARSFFGIGVVSVWERDGERFELTVGASIDGLNAVALGAVVEVDPEVIEAEYLIGPLTFFSPDRELLQSADSEVLVVPMMGSAGVEGALVFSDPTKREWSSEEIEVAHSMARSLRTAMARCRRREGDAARAEVDRVVREIASHAARSDFRAESEFVERSLLATVDWLGTSGASLWRLDGTTYRREVVLPADLPIPSGSASLVVDQAWIESLEARGHKVVDAEQSPDLQPFGGSNPRALVAPVVAGPTESWALAFDHVEPRSWPADSLSGVEAIGRIVGQTLSRFVAERTTHDRLASEVLVKRAATTAVEATLSTIELALKAIAVDLVETLDLFAVRLWRTEERVARLTAGHRADGVATQLGSEYELRSYVLDPYGWAVLDPSDSEPARRFQDPSDSSLLVVGFGRGEAPSQLGALVAVCRPERDFSEEEIVAIQSVTDIVSQLVGRIDAAHDAEDQRVLSELITDLSGGFVEATPETIHDHVMEALARLRSHVDCSSIALFVLNRETQQLECASEATRGDDPVQAPLSPVDRNSPALARILDCPDGTEWDASELVDSLDLGDHTRSFVIPIVIDDDVMFLSAANRDGSSFGDGAVLALRSFGNLVAQTRSRLLLERQARKRAVADRMVGEIAADFVNRSLDDSDAGIRLALENLCRLFNADLASLWRLGDGGSAVRHVHWRADRSSPMKTAGEVPVDHPTIRRVTESRSAEVFELDDEAGGGPRTRVLAPLVDEVGVFGSVVLATDRPLSRVLDIDLQLEVAQSVAILIRELQRRLAADREIGQQLETEDLLRRFATRLVTTNAEDLDGAERALRWLADQLDLDHISVWRTEIGADQTEINLICDGSQTDRRVVAEHAHVAIDPAAAASLSYFGLSSGNWALDDAPKEISRVFLSVGDRRIVFLRDGELGETTFTYLVASRSGLDPVEDHAFSVLGSALSTIAQHLARVSAERSFTAAFESAPIAISIRESDTSLIACNPAYSELTGRTESELIGTRLDTVVSPDQIRSVETEFERAILEGRYEQDAAWRRPDGSIVWVRVRSTPLLIPGRSSHLLITYAEDITDSRRSLQLLEYQASHDELTGLPNRRSFVVDVDTELAESGQCAVLVLDLDRFKVVNDSLGHSVGDQLLVTCADRIRLSLRPGDAVCRLGGDEFAILLRAPADPNAATVVAERLLGLLSGPVMIGGEVVFPTASIGIAIPGANDSVEDLLRHADAAMYHAKAKGRARWVHFDTSLRDATAERIRIESDLRQAVENDQMEVHYQPEFMLETGRIVGAEALIRWRHPDRGLLTAGAFVELAEETGLVVGIGDWVLRKATVQAASWIDEGHDIVMRVNLSARQLRPAVVGEVQEALIEAALAPERLCIELTETAIMDDVEESTWILRQFRDLGVHVAIDDFGTGFSSLAYLKRFPVDTLKIDRSFVEGVGIDTDDTAIVRSIIGLARTLRLDVIAEGIENPSQVSELVRLGCRRGQGFHLAKPAQAADIEALLVADSQKR